MEEALIVEVCVNTNCMNLGALDIIDQIETLNDIVDELHLEKGIEVVPVKALDGSDDKVNCPVAKVGDKLVHNASTESVMEIILEMTGGGKYK